MLMTSRYVGASSVDDVVALSCHNSAQLLPPSLVHCLTLDRALTGAHEHPTALYYVFGRYVVIR